MPDTPEVRFAASTSYLNQLEAKTLYTDDYYISGGGRTDRSSGQVERIDWIAGDKITVFSPQALRYDKDTEPWPLAHKYKVAKMSATTDSVGYSMAHYDVIPADTVLHRHNAGVDTDDWTDALMWNTGESKHSFFAIYPSPQISSVSADHPAISLEKYDEINDVASFTVRGDHLAGDEGIPVNQGVVFDGLNYTYMGAWDTVAANPSAPEPAMRRDYAKYEYLPNMKFVAMAAYKGEQLLSKGIPWGLSSTQWFRPFAWNSSPIRATKWPTATPT